MAKSPPIPGYVPVRTSTLVRGRELPMDVFLPVESRAVRYAPKGEELDSDRVDRLKSHKVSKVLIRKDDEPIYRGYLDEIIQQAEADSQMAMGDRAGVVSAGAETAAQDVMDKPQDKGVFLESLKNFERFTRFLKTYDEATKAVISQSGTRTGDYVFHGSQVAALALFICEKSGLVKVPKQATSITAGCFLHDIGSQDMDLPKVEDPTQYSKAQMELWKQHPIKGAKILDGLDWVDQQIIDIILEHEETPNGDGFPKGLTKKNMQPVSGVVSLVNRFDLFSSRFRGSRGDSIREFTKNELGRYELSQIELLKGAFSP